MGGRRGLGTIVVGIVLDALLLGGGLRAQARETSAAPSAAQATAGEAAQVSTAGAKEETGRVSGIVIKLADGTPLKNATVFLSSDANREHTIATKTTVDGRFALKNVPAGRYELSVRRNGYVAAEYGQKKPSDPGAAFTLAAGENRNDLMFRLIPAAVIAGRVFDEDGEPVPHAHVMVSREVYHEGRRTLAVNGWGQTDDLGQFRLFDLAPGRYYVSATQPGWGQINGDREFNAARKQEERAYAKTYYPGTTDFTKAAVILVKEGEEVPGTDIVLKQVAVYRVRGRVFNQITHKGGKEVELQLVPRVKNLQWDFGASAEVKKSDGSFEMANVAPGSYLLFAYWSDEGKNYSAQEKVDIAESDIEGITLTIGGGVAIPGHIRWEGKPSLEADELQVFLQPETVGYWTGSSARVEANQQFTLKDVNDGEYRVSASGISKDCYLKEVVYGETRARDDAITVNKGGGAALEITISSRGARVQGAAVDKDGLPAAGVWVVVVPDPGRRGNSRLFKSQTTDQYGKYDLRGLAPGEYKVFAWSGIEQGEWEDGEFLKVQEDQGEGLEVREEDVKTVNLKLIEKKKEGGE